MLKSNQTETSFCLVYFPRRHAIASTFGQRLVGQQAQGAQPPIGSHDPGEHPAAIFEALPLSHTGPVPCGVRGGVGRRV